jgi:hypothetical protein
MPSRTVPEKGTMWHVLCHMVRDKESVHVGFAGHQFQPGEADISPRRSGAFEPVTSARGASGGTSGVRNESARARVGAASSRSTMAPSRSERPGRAIPAA